MSRHLYGLIISTSLTVLNIMVTIPGAAKGIEGPGEFWCEDCKYGDSQMRGNGIE